MEIYVYFEFSKIQVGYKEQIIIVTLKILWRNKILLRMKRSEVELELDISLKSSLRSTFTL